MLNMKKIGNRKKAFVVFALLFQLGLVVGQGGSPRRTSGANTSLDYPNVGVKQDEKKCMGTRCPDGTCMPPGMTCKSFYYRILSLSVVAPYYSTNKQDPKQREAISRLVEEQLRSYTREARKIINGLGCAKGHQPCDDGSCLPTVMSCKSGGDFKTLSSAFQAEVDYCYANAPSPKEREALLKLMEEQLRSFTREARKITGLGCPTGYQPCPDGSCMPQRMNCQ